MTARSVTMDTLVVMSPQEAATAAGVGRSTIMRAISNNKLRATRTNRNTWSIRPSDLEAWQADRAVTARSVTAVTIADTPETLAKLAAETARANAAEADRDRWHNAYKEMNQERKEAARKKGDPIPLIILSTFLATALAVLTTALTEQDPFLYFFYGGLLILLCAAIVRKISGKNEDKQ